MVKLIWKGKEETFFHYKGKMYKTIDKKISVPEGVAEKILKHPKWDKAEIKKSKKTKKKKE